MQFKQAKNYTKGRISRIELIVIHDMEAPENSTTAESVASYFAGSNAPRASTHYNIDNDTVVQSVKDGDTAWCAPGANANGLHFEHAGYARQSRSEWLDSYGKKMLELSAKLVAEKCRAYSIPVVHLSPDDIRAGRRGIVGHWDVTRAYPGKGSHTDPGANFPWDYYLERVWAYYKGGTGGASAPKPSTPSIPSAKPAPSGKVLSVDGYLGPNTIKQWQKVMGTEADGVISRPSNLVRAVQRKLHVPIDGVGIASNNSGRYPSAGTTNTIRALQRYLGVSADGYFSSPSETVKALQRRLNSGKF